jgi:hypothetical protein
VSVTCVAGTQAGKVTANNIVVFRMSNLHTVRPTGILKGQCHEMNNFFEGHKSTFCIGADGFKYFCIFNISKSTF